MFRRVWFLVLCLAFFLMSGYAMSMKEEGIKRVSKPKYVRGIHVTGWAAGSKKFRDRLDPIFKNTEINTAVIAVKEANGEVYIPGVKKAEEIGAYRAAIKDAKEYIEYLHGLGIYVVARIVLFKDSILANEEYYWAVHDPLGNVWEDYRKHSWVDPYNKDVWEYNFSVADRCVELGFDEIQFDYIRFPSDGKISNCRYIQDHSSTTAVGILSKFLDEARGRYKEKHGILISVDVFGLTTSANGDLGIGQVVEEMEPYVDFICPMVYPSHYKKGTYNIEVPNEDPYNTVYIAMEYGKEKLGDKSYKYRPYLQDFNLGYNYEKGEVAEQIQAIYDLDIPEWTLWNPRVAYTVSALKDKDAANTYKKSREKDREKFLDRLEEKEELKES